jgi:hypothetical protein
MHRFGSVDPRGIVVMVVVKFIIIVVAIIIIITTVIIIIIIIIIIIATITTIILTVLHPPTDAPSCLRPFRYDAKEANPNPGAPGYGWSSLSGLGLKETLVRAGLGARYAVPCSMIILVPLGSMIILVPSPLRGCDA